MTLAEFIAELEHQAVAMRQRSVDVLKIEGGDAEVLLQASLQYEMAAMALEGAARLARTIEQ